MHVPRFYYLGVVGMVVLLAGALTCTTGDGGPSSQGETGATAGQAPGTDDLPPSPQPLPVDIRSRAAETDQPISEWSDELVAALLEGTGVSPGATTEGDTSALAGQWTATLTDQETGRAARVQIVFDSAGAATELRLFSEELVEAVSLRFADLDEEAKATGAGRLLGTLVRTTDGVVFEILAVAAVDTVENGTTVRTRETFQFVVVFSADGRMLVGSARRTSEVIASSNPDRAAGESSQATGSTELVRNVPPTAEAGDDPTPTDNDGDGVVTVTLDGSASADPDGEITAYTWSEAGGNIATGPTATVDLSVGTHNITLAVTDDDGASGSDTVVVTVQAAPGPTPTPAPLGPVVFVDQAATGANNGTSWTDAFTDLQAALDTAAGSEGDFTEIWVAAGVYRPASPGGDRAASFQLINGVGIYGGFAGGETAREQRDPATNATQLLGDLNGDDLNGGDNSENSYHVVVGSTTDATAILDGFTIIAGNANSSFPDDSGGGIFNESGSPTLNNCTFLSNAAAEDGGAMLNDNSNPTLNDCLFQLNAAGSFGGAINNRNGSSPTLIQCAFNGNQAGIDGGGLYNAGGSPTLRGCTFRQNSAGGEGGAMYNSGSNPVVIESAFLQNQAEGRGAGMANQFSSSPTVINCTFGGNSSNTSGGGMANDTTSNPTVINCLFSGNAASADGGGMYNETNSAPTLTNCTFSRNGAGGGGGGIHNLDSAPTLANCILWGNIALGGEDIGETGQISAAGAGTPVVNFTCIQGLTGALGGTGNIGGDPLFVDTDGADNITGTEDDDLRLAPGSPCIDAGDNASLPADTSDLDSDDDTAEPIPLDLDGNPRIAGATVDMGAFEAQ